MVCFYVALFHKMFFYIYIYIIIVLCISTGLICINQIIWFE